MRLHRFFLKSLPDGISTGREANVADRELIHQWRDVFRFQTGDQIVLFSGNGFDYRAKILSLRLGEARLAIVSAAENKITPKRKVILYQAIIKKDNFEWVLQKGTELGVSEFVPVLAERSEKKGFNFERAEKIITEACEQSGRGVLPAIAEPVPLKVALENLDPAAAVAFDPSGSSFDYGRFALHPTRLAIFIGPEGGWSDNELKLFKEKSIPIVSLGAATLRAETAAVAVSALLLL